MNKTTTTAAEFEQLVHAKRYRLFTFPTLGATIEYRTPDVLNLAYKNLLPTIMSDNVIKAYKASVEGNQEAYQNELKTKKIEADETFLRELRDKGYPLLQDLCSSHNILNVEQSDFSNDVISWKDIPESDAMAFLMNLMQDSTNAQTENGGEVSHEDITTFPEPKRVAKRSTTR